MVKILLVEDNPLNQDMLSRRLSRQGFEVAVAIDGAAGLSMAKTEKPDLILMDMNIPIIDGWEATRRLKADVQTQSIPVVALTAHAMVGDREKAIAAGCDDYATKPVEFKQLLKTIRTFTTKTSPATSLATSVATPASKTAQKTASENPAQKATSPPAASRVSPDALEEAKTCPSPRSEKQTHNAVFTLLVVNDNPTNKAVLSAHLQRRGYTVVAADSAQSALAALKQSAVDLVLLDIMVPDNANLETLQQIRKTYPKTALSVVMITINDGDEDIVRAFDMGASDYVTKPINLAIVMARIKSQLETLQATREQLDRSWPADSQPADSRPASTQPASTQSASTQSASTQPASTQPAIPSPAQAKAAKSRAKQPASKRPFSLRSSAQLPSQIISSPPTVSREDDFSSLRNKRYVLNHVLSKTPMSRVKLVESPELNGPFLCFSEIFSPTIEDESLLSALRTVFTQERSQLEVISNNEKIASVITFVEKNGSFGWLQTYTEGYLLSEELANGKRMSAQRALKSAQEILEALLPFHEKKIVHSSIEPDHLWRCQKDNRISLINLGLSQRLSVYLSQHATENRNAFNYEHRYMPIEQRIGQAVLSSDVYSVGLLTLQMLTGKEPGELTNILLSSSTPFEQLSVVAPEVAAVLSKMLPQDHQERYPSALAALPAVRDLVKV